MGGFHTVDLAILLAYLITTIGIGFWISRRASRSLGAYFLGGNQIPWYMLGLSNASGMFDISGTMWMVYLLFVYGLKSAWIPWLWPVFNQVFLMVYLSVWLRRSGAMTGAEWIRLRFGDGRGAQLAHLVVVVFALISVVGLLAYGYIGIGKFAATFLPWRLAEDPVTNANLYGLIVTVVTTVYVVKGGMFSVVFTEVLQFAIMTIACIWVGVIAMQTVSPTMLAEAVPEGWFGLWFGWKIDLDWSGLLDSANDRISSDGWELFTIFFSMMLLKGVLQSMAGPAPNYDMQRILSARTPREAALLSGFVSVVLLIPRYMLITGLTVLALVYFTDDLRAMGQDADFESILPMAMQEFVPVGLFGLLVSALVAAFMSTYAATVNAAPAYLVNDLYKRYINPNASDKTYVRMSYAASVGIVLVGVGFGVMYQSLNDIVQWIVAALYGGYTASNLLKWHWWRFNSYGYFWGMAAGILGAAVVPELAAYLARTGAIEPVATIYLFPVIFALSLLGCLAGSLLTPPDDEEVLKNFYLRVRPWGFWSPIHLKLLKEHPGLEVNRSFRRDMVNVAVGIVWQTALTVSGIYLVLQDYRSLGAAILVVILTTIFLKFNWYDRLEDYPADLNPAATSHNLPSSLEA